MQSYTIGASVGSRGVNRASDVLLIQKKLNRLIAARKIQLIKLSEDGIVGPKTLGAINQFQLVHVPAVPTGRIDPRSASAITLDRMVTMTPAAPARSVVPVDMMSLNYEKIHWDYRPMKRGR